jgi:hypothetical protein
MRDSRATKIEREIASWPGVSVEPHRFGGVESGVSPIAIVSYILRP